MVAEWLKVGDGATYTIKAPAAGTYVYHLVYTNKCATGFDVTVVSVPLSSTVTNTELMIFVRRSVQRANYRILSWVIL